MRALLDHVTIFLRTLFVIVPRSILARETKVNLSGIWYVLLPTAYDTICSWRHTTSLAVEVCFQVCLLCALQCLTYQQCCGNAHYLWLVQWVVRVLWVPVVSIKAGSHGLHGINTIIQIIQSLSYWHAAACCMF